MANIHDRFVIELKEVIKGYGNDPDAPEPFHLPADYKFYEMPGIAVCEEWFKKMTPLADIPFSEPMRWIPCSERLPKNDEWKIVTIKDESADRPYTYTDFGWYLEAADCWIIDAEQRRDVIAWVPLPSPYKEKK